MTESKHPQSSTVPALAIFDIDGTLRVQRSPWRHLHAHLGLAEEAKEYFPMFQRGELTYEQWVELDAALWRGVTKAEILASLDTNPYRAGAPELVRYFVDRGTYCVAISTGLDILAEKTCSDLKIPELHCNRLGFDGEACTGVVEIFVTEHNKADLLRRVLAKRNVSADNTIVIGDGSADVPMFEIAGKSVAVFPSNDSVKHAATYIIDHEPIDEILKEIFS